MYISRLLEGKIKGYLNAPEIIAITGPRRCGKTTLLQHLVKTLSEVNFLDFTDPDLRTLFQENIKFFAKNHLEPYQYLIIDEIQYARDAGMHLKYLYDTYPNKKIIISGSSASEISIQAIKYLVGRIFIFNLYPLNFEEFLSYKDKKFYETTYQDIKKDISSTEREIKSETLPKVIIQNINQYYEEYLLFGGYPRVVLSETVDEKIEILKNIYNTYFLKEIKGILQIADDERVAKLLKALALQVGQIVHYNELGQIMNTDYRQVIKNIDILEKTFVTKTIRPFYTNKRTELVKNPKVYFIDNGFRNIAIGAFTDINQRPDKGGLKENFICSELIKQELEIRYWRTKSGGEVDFILEKEQQILPIEVKSQLSSKGITKSLAAFLQKYRPKELIVFNDTEYDRIIRREVLISFLPHWLITI